MHWVVSHPKGLKIQLEAQDLPGTIICFPLFSFYSTVNSGNNIPNQFKLREYQCDDKDHKKT